MVNPMSAPKKTLSLSKQIEKLMIDDMGLPSFSLPWVGSRYSLKNTRRILVLYSYQFHVSRTEFRCDRYNNLYYQKIGTMIQNSDRFRMTPYAIGHAGFDLSSIIMNIGKDMSEKDIAIHRFVPYPKLVDVKEPVPGDVYEKAVELFEALLDIMQPTHVFVCSPTVGYNIDQDFRRFRRRSLQDIFDERYIIAVYGGDELQWRSFVPVDEGDSVQDCVEDLLGDVDFLERVVKDPRMKPAMHWDDDKIRYYGADANALREYMNRPAEVGRLLRYSGLNETTRRTLLKPFSSIRFAKMLYSMPDGITNVYTIIEEEWKRECEWIELYDRNLKAYASALKKIRDIYGRAKIRLLSIELLYALQNLSKKLHIDYKSEKFAEIREYIEDLYEQTQRLYAVRKPGDLAPITRKQVMARSRNQRRRKVIDKSVAGADTPSIQFKRKVCSEKQRAHLERARAAKALLKQQSKNANADAS